MRIKTIATWLFLGVGQLCAQSQHLEGLVFNNGEPLAFAQIFCTDLKLSTESNGEGKFRIGPIPVGLHTISVSLVGYATQSIVVEVGRDLPTSILNFDLKSDNVVEEVVVTGTKTFQRKNNSPILVNLLSRQSMDNVQACNVAEGLKFQPGLRVETDCQTCNYTQLRMNGLAGGYSQILINGRPVFSPLTGLYGLEQLPSSMLERIEVVRGGASSTYGPGAIGGTVNIITRLPKKTSAEVAYTFNHINVQTADHILNGNFTRVNKTKNAGVSALLNWRHRQFYDHNRDSFSELPQLKNTSVGITSFWLPGRGQKLELNGMYLNEYRLGGDMSDVLPHLRLQAEERRHGVAMANLDYQLNSSDGNSSFITYLAYQHTKRFHYTGIFPDDAGAIESHLSLPPYGQSVVWTANGGTQYNRKFKRFLNGINTLTWGLDFTSEKVNDNIQAYQYKVDQHTSDLGLFFQSDWQISPRFTLLSGLRWDRHNLLQKTIFSPRISALYKFKPLTQLRINLGTGFRPPQAFDTDLHIAFAGGGVSRVILAPGLQAENSQSANFSFSHDHAEDRFIAGFTLETFYTQLHHAFYLHPLGNDGRGEVFEKRNGSGALVYGLNGELRANFDQKVQIETGFTIQRSVFKEAVRYVDRVPPMRQFVRTPNAYGFAVVSLFPSKKVSINCSYLYTGQMLLPHFAGAPEQTQDVIVKSKSFHEFGVRINFTMGLSKHTTSSFYLGCKNIFNAYQSDFDSGKNRDSNYIYGPSQPRTFYAGIKMAIE